jgi:hypothetical protein
MVLNHTDTICVLPENQLNISFSDLLLTLIRSSKMNKNEEKT